MFVCWLLVELSTQLVVKKSIRVQSTITVHTVIRYQVLVPGTRVVLSEKMLQLCLNSTLVYYVHTLQRRTQTGTQQFFKGDKTK